MEGITYRRAKVDDFARITDLWEEMMAHHLALDPRFELAFDSREAYLEYLASIIENYDYGVFVAVGETQIVGYTISMILANPAVFALERYGFIAEMAVSQGWQRHGVGEGLWNHVRRWLARRGITVLQLNVSPRNQKGYTFWKKMGCDEFLHIMWHTIPKSF
ncbi:MAG: GNAT family N-acetyltransferase [bacterium]|nr:GNAT family N-acetyltransferase [bacterium]